MGASHAILDADPDGVQARPQGAVHRRIGDGQALAGLVHAVPQLGAAAQDVGPLQ
jgi:hypothetical protein